MSATVPGTTLPILEVDEAHWQKIHADAAVAQEYSLKAGNGFQLSTGSFKFPVPEDASFSEPNIIQIVLGRDSLYATAYEKDVSLYNIDQANLVPMYGSKPFEGFAAGSKCIIAIGHLAPPDKENPQPKFSVMWAGVLNVL